MDTAPITITELAIYPVKSLRGIKVESAKLTPQGLEWDRHWMLIDEDGKFITQRKYPQLVLIHTRITSDSLVLSKEGVEDCIIPLAYPNSENTKTATIWKEHCEVVFEREEVHQWFQKAAGINTTVYCVRKKQGAKRSQTKPQLLGEHTHTLFADAAPYLIANINSLAALNAVLEKNGNANVPMENFRPNIVIDGLPAFAEHGIKNLSSDHYQLKHCYPCQRCGMITVDIESGTTNAKQEPFITLMSLNTMPDQDKAPAFGENAILLAGENKIIRVGETLRKS